MTSPSPASPPAFTDATLDCGPREDFAIEVFYDGQCPVCVREIRMLRRLDRAHRIKFIDITAPEFAADPVGIPWDRLMARVHARKADGTIIAGFEVFRQLYELIGFRKLVAVTRIPGIAHLLETAYRIFARIRPRLTGRCDCPSVVKRSSRKDCAAHP